MFVYMCTHTYISSLYICLCMHVGIHVQSYIDLHMYMYTCACMAYFIINEDVALMREMPLDAPNAPNVDVHLMRQMLMST